MFSVEGAGSLVIVGGQEIVETYCKELCLSFGLGSFIPINNYPLNYINFIKYFPIYGSINNAQRLISNENILFSSLLILIFYSLIFSISIISIVEKKISSK